MPAGYVVVFTTVPNPGEGENIARELLDKKLAACVNTVPGIKSSYWWRGKIENSTESLLIIKTKKTLMRKLIKSVKRIHSYKVPEIISMPISGGSKDYLDWIGSSVSNKG